MSNIYEEYYEVDASGNEMYATVLGGDEILAQDLSTGEKIYARDSSQDERYPKTKDGKEIMAQTPNGFKYAKKVSGKQFYPKTSLGEEYVIETENTISYIKNTDGSFNYPLDQSGYPKYPKHPVTNSEVYLTNLTGLPIIGKDREGNERYAVDFEGNQYYPEGDIIAYDRFNHPVYAITNTSKVIYKTNADGDEYYFKIPKTSDDWYGVFLDRYAKDTNGDDIYPQVVYNITMNKEILLNDKYAKTHLKTIIYPFDEYGNEYTRTPEDDKIVDEETYYPRGYPITNDNKIIVPSITKEQKTQPYLLKTGYPPIKEENIVGMLKTTNNEYRNYLTNIISSRKSRSTRKEYFFKPKQFPVFPSKTNWSLGLIITSLVLIVLVFMYRLLFAK